MMYIFLADNNIPRACIYFWYCYCNVFVQRSLRQVNPLLVQGRCTNCKQAHSYSFTEKYLKCALSTLIHVRQRFVSALNDWKEMGLLKYGPNKTYILSGLLSQLFYQYATVPSTSLSHSCCQGTTKMPKSEIISIRFVPFCSHNVSRTKSFVA